MKQKQFTKCIGCGKGVAHAGDLGFYRVKVEHLILNPNVIRRQHGLEMMIGPLASVMGPDEDMASVVSTPAEGLVCQSCALGVNGEPLLAALLSRTEKDEGGEAA